MAKIILELTEHDAYVLASLVRRELHYNRVPALQSYWLALYRQLKGSIDEFYRELFAAWR